LAGNGHFDTLTTNRDCSYSRLWLAGNGHFDTLISIATLRTFGLWLAGNGHFDTLLGPQVFELAGLFLMLGARNLSISSPVNFQFFRKVQTALADFQFFLSSCLHKPPFAQTGDR
ncbi:MAG: hypothetical protein ACK532_22075, partial [Acidobacteriota bacterium]